MAVASSVEMALMKALWPDGARNTSFCVTALPALFHVDALPHEPHDVPVDLVVDENGPLPAGKKKNP